MKAFGRVRTDPSHEASVAELQAQQRKEMEQLREKNKKVLTSKVGEVIQVLESEHADLQKKRCARRRFWLPDLA